MILQTIISQSNNRLPFTTTLENVLNVSNTSLDQVTYMQVYKASDWSIFTFDKPYFCIYSTDHEISANAKIMWGEMDDLSFTNFNEVAEIITPHDGYQQESPYLWFVPTTKSGLTQQAFLTYHTYLSPDDTITQESHLIVSNGGDYLHNSTWIEQNQTDGSNVFGVESGDNHTGYSRQVELPNGKTLAYHARYANTDFLLNKSIFSISEDGYNFSRVANSEVSEGESFSITTGRNFGRLDIIPFVYNSTVYACLKSNRYISIATLDTTTYKPKQLISDIFDRYINDVASYYQHTIYIESGVLYLYVRDLFDGSGTLTGDWYLRKYYLDEII